MASFQAMATNSSIIVAPLPLYSTLIILAGYTYGSITGFIISYFSSLVGAFVVFVIFRHSIPTSVTASILPPSLKRVVRAIEKRPSVFFLIRVAPYPYNVLNAVLGSSSTMGVTRYMLTTAASLVKVIVHTTIGSEIRSFKDFHSSQPESEEWGWGQIWTMCGIALCVALFVYLSIVARRAVDELEDGPGIPAYTAASMSAVPHLASPNPFHEHATESSYPSPPRSEEMVQRDPLFRPVSPFPGTPVTPGTPFR